MPDFALSFSRHAAAAGQRSVCDGLPTAVTTADEAQSISVIDTSPQSADADVAPNESAIAAVAANIFILIIVSLFNLWPDMWLLWSTAFGSVCVAAKQKKAIPTPMMELY